MKQSKLLAVVLCLVLPAILSTGALQAQHDLGPRGGLPGAGGAFPTLNANEQAFFNQAFLRFQEVQSVSGDIPGEDSEGLGPTFNGNSCTMCHAQPAIGGSSPGLASPQNPIPNPQVALANLDGAINSVPAFVTPSGPMREARFIRNPDGSPDGSVHDLYTITGRTDAVGCTLAQPDFAQQLAKDNVIFRIPTPLFGLGLVENTSDATLRANLAATQTARSGLGIGGSFNTNGNDNTITRFGWKAQNKSLLIFAGEAYNVEQGVTNELFPHERDETTGCLFNPTPEDHISFAPGPVKDITADTIGFADFMRFLAPPTPSCGPAPLTPCSASITNGLALFTSNSVGCALCHTVSFQTGVSPSASLSNQTARLFSDMLVHRMGTALADDIVQGAAGPDEFRT